MATERLADRSDDELMQKAARGDTDAYAVLVGRHQLAVRAYCARVCSSRAVGDEVAQEAFLLVWRHRSIYQPRGRFKAYLFTVANSRCRTELRRVRARRSELSGDAGAEPIATSEDQFEKIVAEERSRRVQRCIEKLPEKQQEAIVLRFTVGLGYDEIANLLDKPAATIRSQVFLGLSRLRRLLHPGENP